MLLKRNGPIAVVILAGVMACLTGCKENKPEVEVLTLNNAKIEKINLKTETTGTLQVSFYSEKHRQDIVDEGEVTGETEILIDGAQATLKQLRVGERISGEVRIERKGKEKRRLAVRIVADRPKPVGG
ncbi:MAG: hypothetical protein ACYTHJ_04970 [Planctomycetota bacterium]|jgi:hypothetical protein